VSYFERTTEIITESLLVQFITGPPYTQCRWLRLVTVAGVSSSVVCRRL